MQNVDLPEEEAKEVRMAAQEQMGDRIDSRFYPIVVASCLAVVSLLAVLLPLVTEPILR
jgi:hypothetical protein